MSTSKSGLWRRVTAVSLSVGLVAVACAYYLQASPAAVLAQSSSGAGSAGDPAPSLSSGPGVSRPGILLDVRPTSAGAVEVIETVQLRRNNVRVIGEELRAAEDRFEVGEVTRTDVATAEARLAAARGLLAAAEGQLAVNREIYNAVVGSFPDNPVPPQGLPRIPADVATAKAQALRQHPDIVQLRHVVAGSDIAIAIAKAQMKPTVNLEGRWGMSGTFDSRDASQGGSVTLGLSGPIYQGGGLSSGVRQAMANRDSARAQLYTAGQQIEQSVGSAYAQLRIAQASIVSTQEQVRAARVAFEGIREEATLGARTTLDVLDAEQELLDALAAQISAEVDQTLAAYAVLASIGELTAERLALDVPRYDPAAYYDLVKTAPVSSRQGEELDRVLRALGKN